MQPFDTISLLCFLFPLELLELPRLQGPIPVSYWGSWAVPLERLQECCAAPQRGQLRAGLSLSFHFGTKVPKQNKTQTPFW